MKAFAAVFVVLSFNFVLANDRRIHSAVDCSMGSSSCQSCHAAYPFCYWCDGTCRRFYGKSIAKIECPSKMMYGSCDNEGTQKENSRVEDILAILSALKKQTSKQSHLPYLGENESELPRHTQAPTNKAKLARLLKLLKMLAYLEEKKSKSKVSNERIAESIDSSIHNQFGSVESSGKIDSLAGLKTGKSKSSSTNDLESLLKMVGNVQVTETPTAPVAKSEHKKKISMTEENKKISKLMTKMKELSIDKVQASEGPVVKKTTSSTIIKKQTSLFVNSTMVPRRTTQTGRYCDLFEQEDECNGDKDCSWCNMLDLCVGRNKEDFKYCAGEKRGIENDGNNEGDMCSQMTSCSSCTKKGKCFWCEKTKSCHIYPFFGFIPHNCPANMWYYKECDVQLAIFIILFPLIMILLSMVVFYFCLRFCYYRKKMLKVQLFEKPELFEKRKGKKVYFVGGDDDEDDESRSEQIRKKYNLPHEKEPLISP